MNWEWPVVIFVTTSAESEMSDGKTYSFKKTSFEDLDPVKPAARAALT